MEVRTQMKQWINRETGRFLKYEHDRNEKYASDVTRIHGVGLWIIVFRDSYYVFVAFTTGPLLQYYYNYWGEKSLMVSNDQ